MKGLVVGWALPTLTQYRHRNLLGNVRYHNPIYCHRDLMGNIHRNRTYRNRNLVGNAHPTLIQAVLNHYQTTSLYHYLSQHPKILPALAKELNYFTGVTHWQQGETATYRPKNRG